MQHFSITARSLSQLLTKRPNIFQLKQIHAQIITQPLLSSSHPSLIDSLIHCYIHAKNIDTARTLFDSYPLPSPPALIWNLMIRAYSKTHHSSESFNLLHQLLAAGVVPDKYTFTAVITSCARRKSVLHGQIVHVFVLKRGSLSDLYVSNALVSMYAVVGRVGECCKVFDEMPERDVFSWTSLLSAYAKNGDMRRAGELFEVMPLRNDVSWAVMISGFVGCGMYAEALGYFHEMVGGVRANEAVLVCCLSASAHLGSLDQGKWIHEYMGRNHILKTSNVVTALVDMYAKCGRIDCAYRVFDDIPRPDVQNFTSMISGLSIHGLGKDAIRVFRLMLAKKLNPDGITILGVLNGCSHSGLVQQGSSIFYNMESLWGVVPKIEHYGCFVDLLARAGYLAKAFGVVKTMPMNPDIVIWRALLSGCRNHRSVNFGERIINQIEQIDPRSCAGTDVLLSNLYASLGKWEKVSEIRMIMGKQKKQSDIGHSCIEVNGVVHEFRVADVLHPEIEQIKNKLSEILNRVGLVGYASDATNVSFDLSEEDREQAVALHSEKLAVAYGLMNIPPGACIRIVKNLRSCEDCHNVLKAISKVYSREIVVRDRSRFHTFREGTCSCKDYW